MRKIIFAALFALFIVIMLAVVNESILSNHPVSAEIAAIVYGGGSSDRWKSLELGIRQAFRELEMETPVLYIALDDEAEMNMIEREIEAGVSGLLVAPADSERMAEALEPLTFENRIIFMINAIDGFSYIAADDAGMGALLARELISRTDSVALLPETAARESTRRRREAFLQEMAKAGVSVRILQDVSPENPHDAAEKMREGETLVALETEAFEQWADVLSDINQNVLLAGIGSSDKIVSAMGQGLVDCLVFQNEYAVGYIAAMQLAWQLGLCSAVPEAEVQYLFVDAQTMYNTDVERILFNVIQ